MSGKTLGGVSGMVEQSEIVLCVPGPWPTPADLMSRLETQGFSVSGGSLTTATGEVVDIEHDGPDPRMVTAFGAAGYKRIGPEVLERIGTHRTVAYVIGRGGSTKATHLLAKVAIALLNVGGFAVKVESGGLAYPEQQWRELTESGISVLLQRAFVAYVGDDEEIWSCGMRTLGLPDAVSRLPRSMESRADLIRAFCEYLVGESPTIRSGETFRAARGEPSYQMRAERCNRYAADDLFHNPFGYWRLVPSS